MNMNLSKRLETVISFVKPQSRVADVGTDHGFVPLELVQRGIASSAVAMDVRPGPLSRAQEHIAQRGLQNRIETRLSDGVEKLMPGEADTVIVAGMGGELVIHILDEGRHLWGTVNHWVLSPQSELHKVRRYLWENGFVLEAETMLSEDGKYYTVMDAVPADGDSEPLSEAEALYGPILIRDRSRVLAEFLEREAEVLKTILQGLEKQPGEGAAARRKELSEKLIQIQQIQNDW